MSSDNHTRKFRFGRAASRAQSARPTEVDEDVLADPGQDSGLDTGLDSGLDSGAAREGQEAREQSVGPKWSWRQRLGGAVLGLIVVAAIAAGLVFFAPFFQVKEVVVEGTVHANSQALAESSGIAPGQQLILVDTDAAARAVVTDPWVERATVGRQWPATAHIQVEEFSPVLFMKASDGEHLFAANGKEFITAPPPPGVVEIVRVPRIASPQDGKIDPEPEVIAAALRIVEQLPPPVRERLQRVEAPSANEVSLQLSEDYTFYFGSAERAAEKARAMELLLQREERQWDVSNPQMVTTKK